MPQDNSIPLQAWQGPSPVDSFLQSKYDAQNQGLRQQQATQQSQQFEWMKDDRAKAEMRAKAEALGRAAFALDTPEKWVTQGPAVMQQYGIQGPLPDFSQRQRIISDAMSVQEQFKNLMDTKKFDLDQRQTNAQIGLIGAQTDAAKARGPGGGQMFQSAAERAQIAQSLGIDPRSDAGKRYILTGQMPNGLTPSDRNAVQEADQKVLATSQGVDMLTQARALSDKASQGYGANTISQGLSLVGDQTANNTIEFDNLLQSQVLPQLKVIFGGAPTEGERAILLQLQGSSSLGRDVRNKILDRAILMAKQRLSFYDKQAQGIRGGTYYNPGQGATPAEQIAPAVRPPTAQPSVPPPPPGFKVVQ